MMGFVFLAFSLMVYADVESLKDYPHPIVCKPFVKAETGVIMAEQDKWVILTWAQLDEINEDTLIFKTKDGVFYVPAKRFICSQ